MGQYVFDPVTGTYQYQPDWWEMAGQDTQGVSQSVRSAVPEGMGPSPTTLGGPPNYSGGVRQMSDPAIGEGLGPSPTTLGGPPNYAHGVPQDYNPLVPEGQGPSPTTLGAPPYSGGVGQMLNPDIPEGAGSGTSISNPITGGRAEPLGYAGGVRQDYNPLVPEGTGPGPLAAGGPAYAGGVRQMLNPDVPEGQGPAPGGLDFNPNPIDETANLGNGPHGVTENYPTSPVSGYGMSATEERDAQRRAAGGGMAGGSGAAGGGRAGGGAGGAGGNMTDFLTGEGIGPVLYADPQSGMRRLLRGGGVNPDTNPFAQAALARFSVPVMQALYDFWEVLTGSQGDQAEGMGQFMQEFMAGRINPTALIQQAQAKMGTKETGDENMREMIAGLGPDDFTALQERARGSTPRVAQARGRVMARKAGKQREDMLSDPLNADTDAWLKLIGG